MGNRQDFSAEKQSLKDKLMAIILLETSKPYKEMDSDLVTECVDFLMELEGKQKLTKSEIEQRVNAIPFKGKVTAIGSYSKKRIRAKRLAVIAAVLAVIVALFGIIAIASGNTFSELLRNMGNSIHEWLESGPKEHGDITLYKSDVTKMYSSIEELAEEEGIEILYPSWLPENEKIIKIRHLIESETETYLLQCNIPEHGISIEVNTDLLEDYKTNSSEKEIAGISIYYKQFTKYIQANFVYKNNHYIVKSDTEDNLFSIIENLKEIN